MYIIIYIYSCTYVIIIYNYNIIIYNYNIIVIIIYNYIHMYYNTCVCGCVNSAREVRIKYTDQVKHTCGCSMYTQK